MGSGENIKLSGRKLRHFFHGMWSWGSRIIEGLKFEDLLGTFKDLSVTFPSLSLPDPLPELHNSFIDIM